MSDLGKAQMKSASWEKVKNIFEQAMAVAPGERGRFLDEVCPDDEIVRREVEELLSSFDEAASFLETPAVSEKENELASGQVFGHYEVLRQVGVGGMGEVYLAKDIKLDRWVAIKILNAEFSRHESNLERFIREARAASALNHPNILVIHEIGESEESHFIVSEYIKGKTLREMMQTERRPPDGVPCLSEVLDIAIQIAAALVAAHEAHLVHRDIKPENIMVRPDGLVKVLDFGLAKLVEEKNRSLIGSEVEAAEQNTTAQGMILGTVAYMSPEQAKGERVDERTDIFSFGVLLYEMIAGRTPFGGDSVPESFANLLNKEPPPLESLAAAQIPAQLDSIITKTLRKNPDERYQTSKELLLDLRRLRQQLETGSHSERPAPPEASGAATTARVATRPTAGAGYLSTKLKRHKWGALLSVALLALVGAGIGLGVRSLSGWKQQTALSFQTAKFARLTSTGRAIGAAISPDGKWLVHVQDDGGQKSLWLRQVAVPSSNTQIVPPADVIYWGLTFSPDGNYIYYSAGETFGSPGSLYQTPVLGGATRKLAANVESSVAFSPDGKQIAYFFAAFNGDDERLMIANADGTGARVLAVRRGDDYFYNGWLNSASWSPDGKTIVTPVGNHAESYMSVAAVSVASGELKLLTPHRWGSVWQVAWLGDGSRLLVTAREQGTNTSNIWQLSYPAGEAQKLTNDLNSYSRISLTADGRLLAAVQDELASNIWVMPAFDAAQAKPITQGRNFVHGLSWTPDGRIVYSSNTGGNFDLYAIDARGGEPKQLTTSPGFDRQPFVSPDGRSVVFSSDRAGQTHIWRMDIDGGNVKQVTDKISFAPTFSPDGRWVTYGTHVNMSWKVALDGGQPQLISEKNAAHVTVSPDGKQVACMYQPEPDAPLKPAILSFADGQLIKTFAPPPGLNRFLRWAPDGRAFVYPITNGGVSNLWAQPVDGGPPKQLTNFTAERIFTFDISRDSRQLALSRGTRSSDVVLVSNFIQP